MPRAGVSASAFDAGWDWIEPQRGGPAVAGEAWGDQAYYDWSRMGDFSERPAARRTQPRALRAVPDAGTPLRQRPAGPRRPGAPVPRATAVGPRAAAPRAGTAASRPVTAVPGPVAAVALPLEPLVEPPAATSAVARRTITITGRGAEGHLSATAPRSAPRSYERAGFRPDRIAMWAVLLGVLMILAATTSAHAALLHP